MTTYRGFVAWRFVWQVVLNEPVDGMLVELTRTRGDTVLFLKNKDEGSVPGGLPTVADYTEFADSDSFRRCVYSRADPRWASSWRSKVGAAASGSRWTARLSLATPSLRAR
jgi:hypothetical protein